MKIIENNYNELLDDYITICDSCESIYTFNKSDIRETKEDFFVFYTNCPCCKSKVEHNPLKSKKINN